MIEIFVQTNDYTDEVMNYASRLGGICQNEAIGDRMIEQHFEFANESMAQQFDRSVRVFPEVTHIGMKPDLIAQAIANSKLCKCGWTTVKDCSIDCDALLKMEIGEVGDD